MSRAAQIQWWMDQNQAAQRSVGAAQEDRRRRTSPAVGSPSATTGRDRQPAAVGTMRAIFVGTTLSGNEDEERRRSLQQGSGGGGGGSGRGEPRTTTTSANTGLAGGGSGALGRARQLAAGYQPAVIKVVSYARGTARATATSQYIQRDEVALETHDARILGDHEAVAEEVKAWSSAFAKRAESQDVVAVRLKLHGIKDTPEGRETYEKAVVAGFDGHRYAYRIDTTPDGELEARVVAAMAGAAKERFRVREERVGDAEAGFNQRRFDVTSEARIKARIAEAIAFPTHAMSVDPGATNHGRDGVSYRLNKLIEKGTATDNRGQSVSNASDVRAAARAWGPSLRSQSSRDTMHLVISAKAGTDVAALTNAVRSFLHDRFADHKFMFGVHTEKEQQGHIHAHAVIAVKNELGQKIHPGRQTFQAWREAYAEHAQAQGMKIVATTARERASSQSYGPKDKAIVDAATQLRPERLARDRAYANDPANQRLIEEARQRIQTAKANPIRLPETEPARHAVGESVDAWREVAREQPENAIVKSMLERLTMAQTVGAILHAIENRVDHILKEDNGMAITSEKMTHDLRAMNEAVSRTVDLLDGETKQQFNAASERYLETLSHRVDLQRLQERGADQLSRTDVEKLAGADADRLIARANQIRSDEAREALVAQRLADRAVEVERRDESRGGIDPVSQRGLSIDRGIVRGSEQAAEREAREAIAASEAARLLAEHPAQPLPANLIQTDALAKLRLEQERVVREVEAEKADVQSAKGQRLD